MSYGIQAEVWGPRALFTRAELKVERVSYDVITPSAARGLLESVYFHPGLRWRIDRIHVMNEIRFTSIRRNEVSAKASARLARTFMRTGAPFYLAASENIQQRASLLLEDVHYVIDAHFELTEKAAPSDNEGKFKDIVRRRLEKGQCYSQPYFGCREFAAGFALWQGGEVPSFYSGVEEQDLGFMLYDFDYSDPENIMPMYFRAVMRRGVIETGNCEVLR